LPSATASTIIDRDSSNRYVGTLTTIRNSIDRLTTGATGHLRMEGKEVFRHAVEKLAQTAETALERAGLSAADVDWIVPHQANLRIIKATAQKFGFGLDKVVLTVQDHGNTSAASIPLALSVGVERGQIKPGDLVVTEAIGGGLAWGAVVLRW